MASTLVDLVQIYSNSSGTGAISLGQAVAGYRGKEALFTGNVYSYSIRQDSQYEVGTATYLAAQNSLIRSPLFSSNGGSPIVLMANTQVAITVLAEDLLSLANPNVNTSALTIEVARATAAENFLSQTISMGAIGLHYYATQAVMTADTAQPAGTLGFVYADSTSTNNGVYHYTTGGWVVDTAYAQGAAAIVQPLVNRAAAFATAAAGSAMTVLAALAKTYLSRLSKYVPPEGWVNLADYGMHFADWENPYNLRFYSDGLLVYPMIRSDDPAFPFRPEWAFANIVRRDPSTTYRYRSILLSRRYDPTRQGVAFSTRYVRFQAQGTGNPAGADNTTGAQGQSAAAPWKTWDYAHTQCTALGLCRLIILDNVIPGDSLPGGRSFNYSTSMAVEFQPDNGGLALLTNNRAAVTDVSFNWQDEGQGVWSCNSASGVVPDPVKDASVVYDLGLRDIYNAPTAMSTWADGSYGSDAAIIAALVAAGGGQYNNQTVSPAKLWVRRFDGAKPVVNVNYGYVEGTFSLSLYVDEPNIIGRWGAGFEMLAGAVDAAPSGIQVRPLSVIIPGPRVEKTCNFWFEDPRVYGACGDAINMSDMVRGGIDLGRCKYILGDFYGVETYYAYSNVNTGDRTLEGRHCHNWYWYPLSNENHATPWRGQIASFHSSQVVTTHTQNRLSGIGACAMDVDGAPFADVGASNTLHIAPFGTGSLVDGAGSSPKAIFWGDNTTPPPGIPTTKMRILFGGGFCSPPGTTFAATQNAMIVVGGTFTGPLTTLKTGGGVVVDGFGNTI